MSTADATNDISGYVDPDGEAPWAMQLVVRAEKGTPPTRNDVCTAAAVAVVTLLSDPRTHPDGEWSQPVARWMAGRIRKHTRRARGAAWDRIQSLPGVTIEVNGAQVRAFVPCPTGTIPRDIARLQLRGLDLDLADTPPAALAGGLVIAICPQPELSTGKAAAAAGHAAQLAAMHLPDADRMTWQARGFPLTTEFPDLARWNELRATAAVQVVDAGLTDVDPGTTTAVATWS